MRNIRVVAVGQDSRGRDGSWKQISRPVDLVVGAAAGVSKFRGKNCFLPFGRALG